MNKKFKYLEKKFIAGGCSFTFGHELSDDNNGKSPSNKTWAYLLKDYATWFRPSLYKCTAQPGSGNSGIARRVYQALRSNQDIPIVVVMWSFPSRYDWAMPRHKVLENTRWTSITPWDTTQGQADAFRNLASSEPHKQEWKARRQHMKETGVGDFADALYKYAANEYHEIYLSWKSIIWLQNILEKRKIPYFFTLADNSLFYKEMTPHKEIDPLLSQLYNEIDFTKWFSFGERMMGFNQWALLNEYERGVTHPLDKAHEDAVQLMHKEFLKILGK